MTCSTTCGSTVSITRMSDLIARQDEEQDTCEAPSSGLQPKQMNVSQITVKRAPTVTHLPEVNSL